MVGVRLVSEMASGTRATVSMDCNLIRIRNVINPPHIPIDAES